MEGLPPHLFFYLKLLGETVLHISIAQVHSSTSSPYLESLFMSAFSPFPILAWISRGSYALTSWIQFSSAVKVNLVNTAEIVYSGLD